MIEPVLHFTFENWKASLMALVPLLINVTLFIYVFFLIPHNKLSRLFYSLLVSLSMWQFIDFIIRVSADKASAAYWYYLLSPTLNSIPPLILHFTFLFTQRKYLTKKRWLMFLVYLPAFCFFLLSYGGFVRSTVITSYFWRWTVVSKRGVLEYLNAGWIVACALIVLVLLVEYAIRSAKKNNLTVMRQAQMVAIGFAIPTLTAIVTEFFMPFILGVAPVPLLSTTLAIFSIWVLIALTKYQLLTYEPQHAWPGIMSNMKEGLVIVDNHKIIQFANDTFCAMTGYTRQELLRRKMGDFLIDDSSSEPIKIGEHKTMMTERYDISLRQKNGEVVWCAVTGTPYFDRKGNPIGLVIILSDITDKRAAELALLESESGLKTFMEESLLCVHLYDPVTKRIIYANRAFHNLFQYTSEDLEFLSIYDFINHPKENVDERLHELLNLRRLNSGEREWRRKDGKIINVLVSSVCIQKQGRDIVYIVAQDITASKELEKSLTQKIRDLNIFIYQVSHDIKGPLASIMGLTTLAMKEIENPVHRNYCQMIGQSTKRLDNTLNALLDIIVITQGKIKYEHINLNKELHDIKRTLAYLPNYPKVFFTEDIELREPVITDRAMLLTVLQNLMANAINYADLRRDESVVHFQAREEDGMVKIIVSDNGVGIPYELQDKIWDMFFRASELSKGTGLGLFIVRNAVERLTGDIYLQSEPGVGSRFVITLPAYPAYPFTAN